MADDTIEQKIAAAAGWAVGLGALGVIGSLLQLFGVIELGLPSWAELLNLLIAVAVIALGLLLPRRSLVLVILLLAIFIAIIVDTLIATVYVIQFGGVALTVLLFIRYAIMLNAARAIGLVLMVLIDERRGSANRGALGAATDAPIGTPRDRSETQRLTLGIGRNAVFFAAFAGFSLLVAIILVVALAGEGGFPALALLLFVVAGAWAWAAVAEWGFLPKLIGELRQSLSKGDTEAAQKALEYLRRAKHRGARALAIAMLESDSKDATHARAQSTLEFAQTALRTIGEIGQLDRDAAEALARHFDLRRVGGNADNAAWQETCSVARAALTRAGYQLAS